MEKQDNKTKEFSTVEEVKKIINELEKKKKLVIRMQPIFDEGSEPRNKLDDGIKAIDEKLDGLNAMLEVAEMIDKAKAEGGKEKE